MGHCSAWALKPGHGHDTSMQMPGWCSNPTGHPLVLSRVSCSDPRHLGSPHFKQQTGAASHAGCTHPQHANRYGCAAAAAQGACALPRCPHSAVGESGCLVCQLCWGRITECRTPVMAKVLAISGLATNRPATLDPDPLRPRLCIAEIVCADVMQVAVLSCWQTTRTCQCMCAMRPKLPMVC